MNCHRVQSLISAYVDSELSGLEMLAIRQHLSECPECRYEFESLHGIKKALGKLSAKQPSEDLAELIFKRLDQTPVSQRDMLLYGLRKHFAPFPTRMRWAAAGVGAFAALLAVRAGGPLIDNGGIAPTGALVSMSTSEMQPVRLSTIPASVEEASLGAPPVPKNVENPWEFHRNPEGLDTPGGFVLTSADY